MRRNVAGFHRTAGAVRRLIERKREWHLEAKVNGRLVEWTYDVERDAVRAWQHMRRERTTIDTADPVSEATMRLPTGDVLYL